MTTILNRIDLNLLRVFDAVMEERSVLRAGQRICLSQSAVSHALARLREVLGDELFIRTPNGMQPTARALMMAPLIRQAWRSLETAVGVPKFVTIVMVPRLLDLLRHEAPLIDLVVRSDSTTELAEQIDLGHVDAAIGTFSHIAPRFRSRSLFACDDVLIAGSSRHLGRLSVESLSELSIAAISLHGQQNELAEGFVSEERPDNGLAATFFCPTDAS